MEQLYPAGPTAVPESLTRPTKSYKQRAWLAVTGLSLFVILYFLLAGWFSWIAIKMYSSLFGDGTNPVVSFMFGTTAAFLAIFMLKALFKIKRGSGLDEYEITEKEQPAFFAFLYRLADEVGAPRPHRVFLSPHVNACVFYDLSMFNLIFPSHKNLNLGLGLINVLTLCELKAVLAHEFGHFAQRSMAVGRWVYTSQQIVAHLIAERDGFDRFLQQLNRVDFRFAWIGWILSLIIWSIRSILDIAFRLVIMAERALSREMEMQADLVAVSVSGSDALIHALHRLQAAEDSWDRTLRFASNELKLDRPISDLFTIQNRMIELLAEIFNQPEYGQPPQLPDIEPEKHRIFKTGLAQPPKMWATHPANVEREANAKRIYISAPNDNRSAWSIFASPNELRMEITARLIKSDKPAINITDSIKILESEFASPHLNRHYRGIYLGRSIVRHVISPKDLYSSILPNDRNNILAMFSSLYPSELHQKLENLKDMEEEAFDLKMLRDKRMTAPGGIIRHRDKTLKRKDLPVAILEVDNEINTLLKDLHHHDQQCRSAHLAAAEDIGLGWPNYLRGITSLLHYADHTEANLRDAQGYLANIVAVITADGHVSGKELKRLLTATNEIYQLMTHIFAQAEQVQLDTQLASRLGSDNWSQVLGEFGLNPPSRDNINDWMNIIDSWFYKLISDFSILKSTALEQLLLTEQHIKQCWIETEIVEEAPSPSKAPNNYPIFTTGSERKRQTKLDLWDRFYTADGFFPGVARLTVAGTIVGGVLYTGAMVGSATITIYNGLATKVDVFYNNEKITLTAFANQDIELSNGIYNLTVKTENGQTIENFEAHIDKIFAHYVYNIAGASPLVEWSANYGASSNNYRQELGTPKWLTSTADDILREPPQSVNTKSGSDTRNVLSALSNLSPSDMLDTMSNNEEKERLINTHAKWDDANSRYIMQWLSLSTQQDENQSILLSRLQQNPKEIISLRIQQDLADEKNKSAICQKDINLAKHNPDSADLQYIAIRCLPSDVERDQMFLAGFNKWPTNGWFANATSYILFQHGKFEAAAKALEVTRTQIRPMASLIADDILRMKRLAGTDKPYDVVTLSEDSDLLKMVATLESSSSPDDPVLKAYRELLHGELDEAINTSDLLEPEHKARIWRLAAASDGASSSIIIRAQSLKANQGIDSSTIWAALGLAIRNNENIRPLLMELQMIAPSDVDSITTIIEQIKHGNLKAVEAMIKEASPKIQGEIYSLGVVILGSKTPPSWRFAAKKLLFPHERPYFL